MNNIPITHSSKTKPSKTIIDEKRKKEQNNKHQKTHVNKLKKQMDILIDLATKVGYKVENGKKVRVAKKSSTVIA